jgi:hypothetical protein
MVRAETRLPSVQRLKWGTSFRYSASGECRIEPWGVQMAYRSIMAVFSLPIIVLFSSPPALSDVAVTAGNINGQIRYFQSPHSANETEARRTSERMCLQSGARGCQWLLTIPTGICGAVAISPDRRTVGRASLPDSVNTGAGALLQCQEASGTNCDVTWSYCYPGADERAFPRNRNAIVLEPPPSKDLDLCKQSHVIDEAIGACTRLIKSETLKGTALARIYFYRSFRWMAKGNNDQSASDLFEAQHLDPDQSFATSRFNFDEFGVVIPSP